MGIAVIACDRMIAVIWLSRRTVIFLTLLLFDFIAA
jgi:hypothetical protein